MENLNQYLSQDLPLPNEWKLPQAKKIRPEEIVDTKFPDWWHRDDGIVRVGTGSFALHSVYFNPESGPCTVGIPMETAALHLRIEDPCTNLALRVPAIMRSHPWPQLRIRWPGYQALDEDGLRQFEFVRAIPFTCEQGREFITLSALAQQISDVFREFYDDYRTLCNTNDPSAIVLGPGGVDFSRLRMVRMWSSNMGCIWDLEVAIVKEFVEADWITVVPLGERN
ncbi:hypothetical protein B0H10DRAFT_171824 [Mycena sp. CBHHK59/15]|nr:hypothetical protein B0H10DRAFT_171824 [Mycena sp. CBHHK59/15]